jgi:hypothetical protein
MSFVGSVAPSSEPNDRKLIFDGHLNGIPLHGQADEFTDHPVPALCWPSFGAKMLPCGRSKRAKRSNN